MGSDIRKKNPTTRTECMRVLLIGSHAIPHQCPLTGNEQWRYEQGYYRQTIRQALKQRLRRSKCKRLITSVIRKLKWKLKEKVH